MRTMVRGSLMLLIVLGAAAHASAQASAVDPASLIGEWRGTMSLRGAGHGRGTVRGGDYTLIIRSVEGNVVRGRIVGPDESSSGKLEGTIDGDTLQFSGGGGSRTTLTIAGDSMEGVRQGTGRQGGRNEWAVSVRKKK